MSLFEIDSDADQKNFTLAKMFKRVVNGYRSGDTTNESILLGNSYSHEDYYDYSIMKVSLNETFSNDPSKSDMKKKNINTLFKQVINGDNYIEGYALLTGKASISTGSGDDIINIEANLSNKTKNYSINAGKGDDIIGCNVEYLDNSSQPKGMPKVSFKGGKGRDIFLGIPEDGLTGYVKDFDVKKDSLGFNGDKRRHRFYKTSEGLAIVDTSKMDGMLILEGVNSINQVNIVDIDVF